MTRRYRVVQWATGVVGSAAIRSIVRHPKLELVGVKVYSDAKNGRDAGDIVGIGETGVSATQYVEEIMALDADCVLYCPLPWNLDEMCRLLESGKHVVTPCPYWFPFVQNPDVAASIGESCRSIRMCGGSPSGWAGCLGRSIPTEGPARSWRRRCPAGCASRFM